MINEELARAIAEGLINTGIEGAFNSVEETTNESESYPSISVSQWEGSRADYLLSTIDGGEKFIGMTYPELVSTGMLDELKDLLDSEQGHEAALILLSRDCLDYVEAVKDAGLTDNKCIIYCGMWCPTSTYIVCRAIGRAENDGVDINNIEELSDYFYNNYARLAGCEDYEEGYKNRSDIEREYVLSLEGV